MGNAGNPRRLLAAARELAGPVWLSLLLGGATAAGVGSSSAMADEPAQTRPHRATIALGACELDDNESVLFHNLIKYSNNRDEMTCSPTLQAFAESRAIDMAARGYLSHITPEYLGPNQMLREAGYPLPDTYRDGRANNVESIVGGIESPHAVWRALLASPAHRAHLLGEGAGFDEQNEAGVAYARNIYAPHVDYWVIVIARRARPDDPELICTPPPATCFPVAAEEQPANPAR